MKRVFTFVIGALVLSVLPALAQDPAKPAADAPKMSSDAKKVTVNGKVSAVTADSLTIAGKDGDMTFVVDATTKIQAKGASHTSDAMKDKKKPTQITDSSTVATRYRFGSTAAGDKKHAVEVIVQTKATVTK